MAGIIHAKDPRYTAHAEGEKRDKAAKEAADKAAKKSAEETKQPK